jgi:hypothetical protein
VTPEEQSKRRVRTVLHYIESVLDDIDHSIEESESRDEWKLRVRGILAHWMGAVYDEGVGERKDIETANQILKKQVEMLRALNKDLLEKLASVDRYGTSVKKDDE